MEEGHENPNHQDGSVGSGGAKVHFQKYLNFNGDSSVLLTI